MYSTPTEILASIFSSAMGNLDISAPLSAIIRQHAVLLAISGVCRRWRLVALEYGQLWGAIAFSLQDLPTINLAGLFLQRSGNAPLFVRIDGPDDLWAWDNSLDDPARSVILELSEELHRVCVCKLNLPPPYIWEIWTIPAPQMDNLALWVDDRTNVPFTFVNQIQGIQTISFSSYPKWPTMSLSSLTTVILENKHGDIQISVDRILEPLDNTPNLTSLVLCGYSNLVSSNPFKTRLLALRTLDIRFCDSIVLLDHLQIPNCTTFSITSEPPAREPLVHRGLFPNEPLDLSVVFDVRTEDYCIDALSHLGIRGTVRYQDTWEAPSDRWITAITADLPRITSFSSVITLEVRLAVFKVPWSGWIPHLQNVMTIGLTLSDYTDLFDSLMMTTSTTSPPCPRLQTISFRTIDQYVKVDYVHFKRSLVSRIQRGFPLTRVVIPAYHSDSLANSDDWWGSMWSQGILVYC